MANPNGNPKNLKPLKPGQSGNPKGRPKNPPQLREIQQLTKGEYSLMINKMLQCKPEDLANYNGTVLEKWVASVIYHGIKHGDPSRLASLIDRLIGKVPEKVELTEHEKVKSLSDEELLDAAVKAVEALKLKLQGKAK